MPKKPPRNAYYFFMQDFREEQRKQGITYNNMSEVASAASPAWMSATPQERAKYDALAKAEKAKSSQLTSSKSLNAIAEQNCRDAEQAETQDIKKFIQSHREANSLLIEDFYLIDVNCYCGRYLVGELTILEFNLLDGLKDNYHEVINPGVIPVGYGLEVKMSCKELGLPMVDEYEPPTDFKQTLKMMMGFLRRKQGKSGGLPVLYTLPEKVVPVVNFLHHLCTFAGKDVTTFRVYRLDTLFYLLVGTRIIRGISVDEEDLEDENFLQKMALARLEKDEFKYSFHLACPMHEEKELGWECTLSRTKRWAFTMFDICLLQYKLAPKPGRHVPLEPDDNIDSSSEHSSVSRPEARVFNLSFEVPATESTSKKPAYVPMRRPHKDYSKEVRASQQSSQKGNGEKDLDIREKIRQSLAALKM